MELYVLLETNSPNVLSARDDFEEAKEEAKRLMADRPNYHIEIHPRTLNKGF